MNMTIFNPDEIARSVAPSEAAKDDMTLQGVVEWLESGNNPLSRRTRRIYRAVVRRAAKLLRRKTTEVLADRETLLAQFSLQNHCNGRWKSVKAQSAFRRNLSAAINGAAGVISSRTSRSVRDDSWKQLLQGLDDAVDDPCQSLPFHEKKRVALSVLADFARQIDLEVNQIDKAGRDALLGLPMTKGQKAALRDGLKALRDLQNEPLDKITWLLPQAHVPSIPSHEVSFDLPVELREELKCWIHIATRGAWSETDEDYVGGQEVKPILIAARKVLKTQVLCGHIDIKDLRSIAFAFDKAGLVACVKMWRRWSETGHHNAISAKTANDYLHSIVALMERNGESVDFLREIIKNDSWLSAYKTTRSRMTRKNRDFCRRVVTEREQRLKFQSHHIRLRLLAQWHLDMSKKSSGKETEHHEMKARQFGACAAFAAIESDISPIRANVALRTTHRGANPWLELGHGQNGNGHLTVPAADNKNGQEISVPIAAESKLRGLSTLRWYEAQIRPLFEASPENDFFFPAVKDGKSRLPYATLKKWWDAAMMTTGFGGMTPHMFRHGQASILAAKNPGNWTLISVRLGDAESTCRNFYAWINDEQLVLRGQELLTEEFPHASAA
jgi:hypothetical protein